MNETQQVCPDSNQKSSVWGVVPAAGKGSRIQPLAFSKELLPVGSTTSGDSPHAVAELLLDRFIIAGVNRIIFIIAPDKTDILEYFGDAYRSVPIVYLVQKEPHGLCDAVFKASLLVRSSDRVVIGLPDTIWYPEYGLSTLPPDELAFLLFPTDRPELFDSVSLSSDPQWISEIRVKSQTPESNWIWGAFAMPGAIFADLYQLWLKRAEKDEYIGTLVNAYLKDGGKAIGRTAGTEYYDVGTLSGFQRAVLRGISKREEQPSGANTFTIRFGKASP